MTLISLPDDPAEQLTLAKTMLEDGKRAEAVDLCRRLVVATPDLGAAWGEVAQLCRLLGDDDAAAQAGRLYFEDKPTDPSRLGMLAELLSGIDRADAALKMVEALIAQHADVAGAQYGAGYFCSQLGDFEKAIAYHRRALELVPDFVGSWEQLARLKRFTAGDPEFEALKRLVDGGDQMRPEMRLVLSYALGKAYQDLGDFDRAYDCLAGGAALMHGLSPFETDAYEAYCDRLKETFSAAEVSRLATQGASSDRPIFIVGVPRSGTTLVEQIVASHAEVKGGGELKFLRLTTFQLGNLEADDITAFLDTAREGGYEIGDPWTRMGLNYLSLLDARFGSGGRIVDKNLDNHLLIGALGLMLPGARILYCTRDPMDTAWSCFKTRFTDGHFWSYAFDDLARYMEAYGSLMDHWRSLRPEAIHEVRYESLVADTQGETERLLAFCGLPPDPACLRFDEADRVVSTLSMTQVRKPIYKDSVGAWKAYEKYLGPLTAAMGI